MRRRPPAVHAPGIPCGLPSPGSRRQSSGFFGNRSGVMRPMRESDALVAGPGEQITCKRCRRIVRIQRAPHSVGCICDDCTVAIGKVHADADAACGRKWTCQYGACKRAREINIHRAFAKLEYTQQRFEAVRKIKAL